MKYLYSEYVWRLLCLCEALCKHALILHDGAIRPRAATALVAAAVA